MELNMTIEMTLNNIDHFILVFIECPLKSKKNINN